MIRAIVFDCFGVLASDGWLPYKARYFADDPELEMRVTLLNRAVDAGQASYSEFIREVANMAGLTEAVAREQIENNIPDESLFTYIRELKTNYKIGMLSNAGDNWLQEIFLPEQVSLFDAVALSCETGLVKPDIQAYEVIAKRLGVAPSECVFIDDQPRYAEGARQAGMQAIVYGNAEQLHAELTGILTNAKN